MAAHLQTGTVDNFSDTYVLQQALTGYSYEAYTNERKLSGTGIVSSGNDTINVDTETFIGQFRWKKPLNPVVNTLSLTNSADGTTTHTSSDYATYVKSARSHGAEKINMSQVVTKEDGLAQIGKDFGETRAKDEHGAILSILKGVAISELLNGAGQAGGGNGLGGQSFDNDPTDMKYGFYVDLGAAKPVVDASATQQGAARAEGFLQAMGMAWKDYEPDWCYLIVSPQTLASLRSANLVDQDRVADGNVNFETIFSGKFRLITTRANQSLSSGELAKMNHASAPGVNVVGTKTSFIVLPGAIALENLEVPMPTEIQRTARKYQGGGTTEIWYRWGYVMHPAGYTWKGKEDDFASDVSYTSVIEGSTQKLVTAVTADSLASTAGVWQRKTTSALSLGILPVFHS